MGRSRSNLTQMKIVFFGTPTYVVPILEALYKKFKNQGGKSSIAAVVTQPPKPTGRKKIVSFSPSDKWAYKHKVPVYYEPGELIKLDTKFDLGIIADYGKIITKDVIDLFKEGILNLHFSLLPKYRGASPVQAAIVEGDKEIGVTIFKIDKKLDHGAIITQFKEDIKQKDNAESLRSRLFEKSVDVLVEMIPAYIDGKINLKPQDDKSACFTRTLTKDDGFIERKIISDAVSGNKPEKEFVVKFINDFKIIPDSEFIERYIRAMSPWPGVWTTITIGGEDARLKILSSHIDENRLQLDKVQLEGKNAVTWEQFLEGHPNFKFS